MLKLYPSGFARFVASYYLYSGPRKRIRNVTFSMQHDAVAYPGGIEVQAYTLAELISTKIKGDLLALKKSLGRFISDPDGHPPQEQPIERAGMLMYQSNEETRIKQFLTLPWLVTGVDPTEDGDVENLGATFKLAKIDPIHDPATPDTIILTQTNKMAKAVKLRADDPGAELGDTPQDAGADQIVTP